ncbi:MAG: AAA family ATPase [Armatimonadetes bacterium]|nr:AAA family ATPase [Armatimonadota bacterium]
MEEEQAAGALAARQEAEAAVAEARRLLTYPPGELSRAGDVGLDSGTLLERWKEHQGSGLAILDPKVLASHLEEAQHTYGAELSGFAEAARNELGRRESAWQPVAARLLSWLELARTAERGKPAVKTLKQAEKWLKDRSNQIGDQRFAPIGEQARQHWALLRQDSNVELESVILDGVSTQRRVSIGVSVDGVPGVALGVMSQGELHSLALSIFLPRAMLPESPFRFMILDDPVQAMDPAKVDGLARVLQQASQNRQVVVCTHDNRLFESIRRLSIPADVLEVTRRANSVVELRKVLSPCERALADAQAVALTGELEDRVAQRVVPGFCREAVEARLSEILWRKRLEEGLTHRQIEELLESVNISPPDWRWPSSGRPREPRSSARFCSSFPPPPARPTRRSNTRDRMTANRSC